MDYETDWWGITLIAHTPEDIALLQALRASLPTEPNTSYQDGNVEAEETPNTYRLIFNR